MALRLSILATQSILPGDDRLGYVSVFDIKL